MKCVLVIDDSRASAFMAQTIFRRRGAQVLLAMDGRTGIQMARTQHPDIILLDYVLPDMRGDEVCRILKNDPVTAEIPILIVTVYSKEGVAESCREAGAEDILFKPYTNEELVNRVSQLLQLPHRQYVRILVRMETTTTTPRGVMFGTSENLSEGGIYVRTTHRLQEGEKVRLRFYLPKDSQPLTVEGEIVRTEFRPDVRGYGYGIKFTRLSAPDLRRLKRFINDRMELLGKSPPGPPKVFPDESPGETAG